MTASTEGGRSGVAGAVVLMAPAFSAKPPCDVRLPPPVMWAGLLDAVSEKHTAQWTIPSIASLGIGRASVYRVLSERRDGGERQEAA
jgi:hypothetical protein